MIHGSCEVGMELKIIKTEEEYKTALREIEGLMTADPPVGTPAGDRLELLALLVEKYEKERFPRALPDPVAAIQFRMEQQGLSQRDLVPYVGSRSKVSEILSHKRPLTLSMIRSLNRGLGIPAEALLQSPGASLPKDNEIEWQRFPLAAMKARGWISGSLQRLRDSAEEVMRDFLSPVAQEDLTPLLTSMKGRGFGLPRQTGGTLRLGTSDSYALIAWTVTVMRQAQKISLPAAYRHDSMKLSFLREVCRLSWSSHGPLLAKELLERNGIPLVIVEHLPGTHLDGMAIMLNTGQPIIGLTLRHDRIDNFWFVLMHELVHVWKHLGAKSKHFFDDLDIANTDDVEREADLLAMEALIPQKEWENSRARSRRSHEAARQLGESLRIHPAIVAGRIRAESRNFRILSKLVGHGEVRRLFESSIATPMNRVGTAI